MNTIVNLKAEGVKALCKENGKIKYHFFYDGVPVMDADGNDTGTANYTDTAILMRNATYEKMVDACIAVKYDISAQLALLYNYQQDAVRYAEEMEQYQQWRTYCKDSCRQHFNL